MSTQIKIPVKLIKAVKRFNYKEDIRPLYDRTFQVHKETFVIINPYLAIVMKHKNEIDTPLVFLNHKLKAVLEDSIFKGKDALVEVTVEKMGETWIAGEQMIGTVKVEDVVDPKMEASQGLSKVNVKGEFRAVLQVKLIIQIMKVFEDLGITQVQFYTGGIADPVVFKAVDGEVLAVQMPLRSESDTTSIESDLEQAVGGAL